MSHFTIYIDLKSFPEVTEPVSCPRQRLVSVIVEDWGGGRGQHVHQLRKRTCVGPVGVRQTPQWETETHWLVASEMCAWLRPDVSLACLWNVCKECDCVFSLTRVYYLVTCETVPVCRTVLLMVGVPHTLNEWAHGFSQRESLSQSISPSCHRTWNFFDSLGGGMCSNVPNGNINMLLITVIVINTSERSCWPVAPLTVNRYPARMGQRCCECCDSPARRPRQG